MTCFPSCMSLMGTSTKLLFGSCNSILFGETCQSLIPDTCWYYFHNLWEIITQFLCNKRQYPNLKHMMINMASVQFHSVQQRWKTPYRKREDIQPASVLEVIFCRKLLVLWQNLQLLPQSWSRTSLGAFEIDPKYYCKPPAGVSCVILLNHRGMDSSHSWGGGAV